MTMNDAMTMNDEDNMTKAILLLEDGTVFTGKAGGKTGTTTGEICFNTGMTGYQEIFRILPIRGRCW